MGKLTKAQREVLAWIGSQLSGGVTDITDRRTVNPLMNRGLLSYDTFQDVWRITPAGRAALSEGEP